jgi:hypothetical protein
MKFYVCHDSDYQAFDCCFTLQEAKEIVHCSGGGEVLTLDLPITAETIQRLLGNIAHFSPEQMWLTVN